jgi:hypothetical protein
MSLASREDLLEALGIVAVAKCKLEEENLKLREALLVLAPAIAVCARMFEVAPQIREELLQGEVLLLTVLGKNNEKH